MSTTQSEIQVEDINPLAENLAQATTLVGERNQCQFVAIDTRYGEIVDHDDSEDVLLSRITKSYAHKNELCFISIIHAVSDSENR